MERKQQNSPGLATSSLPGASSLLTHQMGTASVGHLTELGPEV